MYEVERGMASFTEVFGPLTVLSENHSSAEMVYTFGIYGD